MNEVRSVYGEVGLDNESGAGQEGFRDGDCLPRGRVLVLTEGCIGIRWQRADRALVAGLLAGARSGRQDRLWDASTQTRFIGGRGRKGRLGLIGSIGLRKTAGNHKNALRKPGSRSAFDSI